MVKGSLNINESVELKINLDQRNNVRAYHSATHLQFQISIYLSPSWSLLPGSPPRYVFSEKLYLS